MTTEDRKEVKSSRTFLCPFAFTIPITTQTMFPCFCMLISGVESKDPLCSLVFWPVAKSQVQTPSTCILPSTHKISTDSDLLPPIFLLFIYPCKMPVILRGRKEKKSELEMETLVFKPEPAAEAMETNQSQSWNEDEEEEENGADAEETESLSDFDEIGEEQDNLQKLDELGAKSGGKTVEEWIVNWCVVRQERTDNFSIRLLYTLPVCFLGLFTFAWRICFNYFLLCFCLALTIAILCFLIFCAPFHLSYRFISNHLRPQQPAQT